MSDILRGSTFLSLVGVLVVLTNITVQVLKKATWDRLPTNLLVVIISLTLTLCSFFAFCQIKGITIVWYMIAAAVVLSFLVAYAAMFGYDKLCEAMKQIDRL